MKRILVTLVLCILFAVPVYGQDDPTPDVDAWQTQVAMDQASMTLTAIAPTVEPSPVPQPNINVTVESPAAPVANPANNTELYLFLALIVVVVGFLGMGYLGERRDIRRAAEDYQQALNRAAENKYTQYDELGIELYLRARGFDVERQTDGTYKVSPPTATSPEFHAQVVKNTADIADMKTKLEPGK